MHLYSYSLKNKPKNCIELKGHNDIICQNKCKNSNENTYYSKSDTIILLKHNVNKPRNIFNIKSFKSINNFQINLDLM